MKIIRVYSCVLLHYSKRITRLLRNRFKISSRILMNGYVFSDGEYPLLKPETFPPSLSFFLYLASVILFRNPISFYRETHVRTWTPLAHYCTTSPYIRPPLSTSKRPKLDKGQEQSTTVPKWASFSSLSFLLFSYPYPTINLSVHPLPFSNPHFIPPPSFSLPLSFFFRFLHPTSVITIRIANRE